MFRKLRGLIIERVGSMKRLAEMLGITPGCLSHKLNGRIKFTLEDAFYICKILGIPKSDIPIYFDEDEDGEGRNED